MPLQARIAGLDLSLGGAPVAAHISALSTSPRSATIADYPSSGRAACASPPGYRINSLQKVIGSGSHAWKKATRALESAEAFELPWVRFWRTGHGSRWSPGDVVVMAARILPFVWTANVNRVTSITRRRGCVAVAWGTTSRHVLRGEELISVQRQKNGDVLFQLRSFSRPKAFMAWVAYPVVVYLQHAFARGVCRRLMDLAREPIEEE